MAVVNILISARNQANAAFTAARAQTQALSNSISSLTGRLLAQQRVVSSVAGAYRDANGLWRNANGTLLTQRHTVTTVTTAFGRLVNALQRTRTAALAAALAIGGPLRRALDRTKEAVGDLVIALARQLMTTLPMLAAKILTLIGLLTQFAVVAGDLSGLLMLIAPAAIAGAAALVTLKLGLHGVGDAIKAGLEGDVEKFREALKKISPQAAGTVKAIVEIAKSWRALRRTVQDRLFHNLGRELLDTQAVIMPLADKYLPRIASAFNQAAKSVLAFFRTPEAAAQLDTILAAAHVAISGILRAAKPLAQAFLDIAEVAAPGFADLGTGIGNAAERFAGWIRQLKDDGTLARWLDRAKEIFGKLTEIGKEVGRVFSSLFKDPDAHSDALGFLDAVKESLRALADWLHGEDGQAFIKWAKNGATAIAGIGSAIESFLKMIDRGLEELRDLFGRGEDSAKRFGSVIAAIGSAFGWVFSAMGALSSLASHAWSIARSIQMAINSIVPRTVFLDIVTRRTEQGYARSLTPSGGGGGRAKFTAHGGIAGGLTWVGERGAELLRLPHGSQVYSNEDTRRMLATSGGGQASTLAITIAPARGVGDPLAEAVLHLFRTNRIQMQVGGQAVRAAVA